MPLCGSHPKERVLIVGGQFTGNFVSRDLKKHFNVTVVDAKEFFEYTPGILRAYVKPAHFDSLSFTLQPVFERSIGVKFIWGEVLSLDGDKKSATIQTMFATEKDEVSWDYCMICSGCNFNPLKPMGESLWFPTVHLAGREVSEWKHIDERYYEGRRRHILEEYHAIAELAKKKATVLIVGAGFIGVEWITELEYFFPDLETTICDMLPACLGPLPQAAKEYCEEYMVASGISTFYGLKYPGPFEKSKGDDFWKTVKLEDGADKTYVCMGVKASNYFMPAETLSKFGPMGGKWIMMNEYMQVCKLAKNTYPQGHEKAGQEIMGADVPGEVWAGGRAFAIGDCNYGCIMKPGVDPKAKALDKNGKPIPYNAFRMPPIPKISYPGEEQALHAVKNLEKLAKAKGGPAKLMKTWWPWGAGMFATSLGPHDACFVLAANENPGSGYMINWWLPAAYQKEIIETTKVNEMKDVWIGKWIWHFVHHTPVHCWGKGAFTSCKKGI
jgi:hypothetical protein